MLPARLADLLALASDRTGEPGVLHGDPATLITSLGDREDPSTGVHALGLLDDPRHLPRLRERAWAALLATPALGPQAHALTSAVWLHPRARAALAALLATLLPPPPPPGIAPSAVVHPTAWVDPGATVGPQAVVAAGARIEAGAVIGAGAVVGAGAVIGEGTELGPRAVIAPGVSVGRRCRIDAGAVIGAHGFGYLPPTGASAVAEAIPHVGGVVLEDDVHVGALTTIARGTLGPTRVRRGARIDAQVHVGHNCDVGAGAFLAGQVGLAGSVTVGAGAMLGGKAGVADHRHIGAGARVAAGSGVTADVPTGATWGGYPARPRARWLRATAKLYGKGG